MIEKLLLALRNNAHRVAVIKTESGTREVLGVAHPEEQDRRAGVLKQWGIDPASPRQEPPATIDEPLPQRTQTILSYRLDPALRRRIDTGIGEPADSRVRNRPGKKDEANLRGENNET
ncbi:MAG TPA: hypothetical protein VEC06_10325 [Paucimonas sp.]|nr:hypothetical protein [Paucimonas sp.]